ncbi:MAG: tRNA (cytidine32/uridine32-2'-O)-methyltransferase [Oleispira sp.]|jgi:tRNA (cytidine32/uridine32-2'-O)-methyltransferase|tara:strand:+ start:5161 stop:5994 length:834 start_codon:yes stop_codon:yes gene_type:complete
MLDQIRIVLVNTTHSGNIGAAARAMKNMGVVQLVLVDPIAEIDGDAIVRASGASEILDSCITVSSLEEAVAECGLVIGTSARGRHIPWPLCSPRECAAKAKQAVLNNNSVALVFGRESRGLTNDELHRCNAHVHIPTNPDFSSLNIAAAVQVLCYEMRLAALEQNDAEEPLQSKVGQWGVEWDYEMAPHGDVERFFDHLKDSLVDIGFLDPNTPKQLMTRLRRMFQRTALDKMEVGMMRGILAAVQRKTKAANGVEAVESAEGKVVDKDKAEDKDKG